MSNFEPTPKRLSNQKWLFRRSFHFSQSADTQASPNLVKVKISPACQSQRAGRSKIDSVYKDGTFRSGLNFQSWIIFLILLIPVFAHGQKLMITNVHVVPMTSETVLQSQDLVIEDGKITSINPALPGVPPPSDATAIDGTGKYITPGWAEMHAHIPTPAEGDTSNVYETLFLYLSKGITTIRGMLGQPYHLALRAEVQEDLVMSPRIYTSSPSMNGNSIPSKDSARMRVLQYEKEGYDFLKIHPGLKRDVFDEMIGTAQTVGIKYSGHVPLEVGIDHAIASGYASIDHLDGYIEGLAPEDMRNDGGFFGILLADHLDSERIAILGEKTAARNIAVVPTQTLFTRWLAPHQLEKQMRDPEMAYIPGSLRFTWRQNKELMLERLEFSEEQYDRFVETRKKLIRTLHEKGVLMLLGSDAPQVMNVPGFSIHHEMQTLADAGLTPYQILQTGTVNVARFFGTESDTGTLEEGKVADLVLLRNNPLDNISHCNDIDAVIYRGQILSREKIEEKLTDIASKYEEE